MNKQSLLFAIKKSSSVDEVAKRMGKIGDEEKIWDKLLRYYPAAEDFLNRNEALNSMRDAFANGDLGAVKESRYYFIAATNRLINNKMITEKDVNRIVATLNNKRSQKNAIVSATKEKNSIDLHTEHRKNEDPDSMFITSEITRDIINTIISKYL